MLTGGALVCWAWWWFPPHHAHHPLGPHGQALPGTFHRQDRAHTLPPPLWGRFSHCLRLAPRTLRLRQWQCSFKVPRGVRSGPGLPRTKVDTRRPSVPPPPASRATSGSLGLLQLSSGPRSTAPAAQARARNGCPAFSTRRAGQSVRALGTRVPGHALLAPRHPVCVPQGSA